MGKHSDGKMNWKVADTVWEGLRERLIWGGIGLVVMSLVIGITELLN